jgi:hypothetical protein
MRNDFVGDGDEWQEEEEQQEAAGAAADELLELAIDEEFECPYCGEANELEIDPLAGTAQQFTQDCWICCRPILMSVEIRPDGDGGWRLELEIDREAD